jgi:hypothetical protein
MLEAIERMNTCPDLRNEPRGVAEIRITPSTQVVT